MGSEMCIRDRDIQAAFDTIKPGKIREALENKGVEPLITNWYYNYLTHRNVKTKNITMKKPQEL